MDGEAERLEHAISERFEDALDVLLDHPTEDPHGDPIPSKTGEVIRQTTQPLSELALGQAAIVRRVSDDDAARLRYLAELGLTPGASVCVLDRAPFGGPIRVQVSVRHASDAPAEQTEHAVGPELAADIQVALVAR